MATPSSIVKLGLKDTTSLLVTFGFGSSTSVSRIDIVGGQYVSSIRQSSSSRQSSGNRQDISVARSGV